MTNISVKIAGASATAKADGKLTSGMVGVGVTIEYDSSWNGLIKTASFKAGDFIRSRENIGTTTTVPWEVMRRHGKPLEIGVEGRDADGNIVIPTTWASVSTILPGATASIPGAPNPDVGEIPSGGGAVIDDSVITSDKTWSSQKISDEISNIPGGSVSETDYRHIFTYEHTAEEGVLQIDITRDKDGNAFSCSEFHIHMTNPPAQGTQLYIGSTIYNWMLFMAAARSETYTKTLSIDLQHIGGGWWNGSILNDVIEGIPGWATRNGSYLHSNFRSNQNIGEKASSLCIHGGTAPFPNGTVIEIYGK